MKIAIIGGGWMGCHIASKLKSQNHNITIFEKSDIFSGSSFYNQNRLHNGFHYSRNKKTRKLCYDSFNLFINDYKHLVKDIPNNYYIIPQNESLIDFETFKNIFNYENIPFIESNLNLLSNIEGGIIVNEKYINPFKTKDYFKTILKENIIIKEIHYNDLNILSKENDLVIDVTNNTLHSLPNHYYELSLVLIYEKIKEINFGAITMVDGPFFSIYPYKDDKEYTITDVQYTPLYTSDNMSDIERYKDSLNNDNINYIKSKIEEKISYYYNEFIDHFKYKKYYISLKIKKHSQSADRYPTIIHYDNVIACSTGKIQGIYTLENYIYNEIINR